MKVYRSIEALQMMGIICTPCTADQYIRNMYCAGVLETSFKVNGRWSITQNDIEIVKQKIMKGEYKPSARYHKQVA